MSKGALGYPLDRPYAEPPAPAWVGADTAGTGDFLGNTNALGILTWVPVSFTAVQMGFRVITQLGNMILGIYDANRARLYQEPSFLVPAAGPKRKTLTTPVLLPAGPLYLFIQVDDAGSQFAASFNTPAGQAFVFANTYADGLPAMLPATLADNDDAPSLIAIREGF